MSKKTSYHHGNLTEEITAIAVDRIRKNGVQQISLRQLAADCGVSPTAVYRHFNNKEHLLAHIAKLGFENLHQKLQDAGSDQIQNTVLNRAMAYIQFAMDNPCYFDLMFGPYIPNMQEHPELDNAMKSTFKFLEETTHESIQHNIHEGDAELISYHSWALIHGLALLISSKHIPLDNRPIDQQMILKIITADAKHPLHDMVYQSQKTVNE
ncbi:MAG: TetR/AcrR family transcriptional regulator [Coxiellaceae bacterium]|nr:TetR/AcrR family transcriptional regulator [Coxiellaceae bacterium]